jgi:hypothetical protein
LSHGSHLLVFFGQKNYTHEMDFGARSASSGTGNWFNTHELNPRRELFASIPIGKKMEQGQADAKKKRDEASQHPRSEVKRVVVR